jgi:hypothetical protein
MLNREVQRAFGQEADARHRQSMAVDPPASGKIAHAQERRLAGTVWPQQVK